MLSVRFNKDALLESPETWPAWEINLKFALGEDAWKQVEYSIPKPEAPAEVVEWKRDRHFACSTIIVSIKVDHTHLLNKCGHDPHAMYLALKRHFQPDSHLDKVSLMQDYFNLKLKSATSLAVDNFLREYQKHLGAIKQHNINFVDDWVISAHLLSTLPTEFNTLRTFVGNSADLPTIDILIPKIRTEARQINHEDPSGASVALAAASHQTQQGAQRKPTLCPGCKKGAHWLSDCTDPDGVAYRNNRHRRKKGPRPTAAAAVTTATVTSAAPTTITEQSQAHLAQSAGDTPESSLGYAFVAPLLNNSKDAIYIDTGCTWTVVGDRNLLTDIKPIAAEQIDGVGGTVQANEVGTLCLQVASNRWITFTNVRLSKGLPATLLSVNQLKKMGFYVDCQESARVYDKHTGKTVFTAPCVANGLFQVMPVSDSRSSAFSAATLTTWHRRLCHLNADYIRTLARDGLVDGLDFKHGSHQHSCTDCLAGKAHKLSFPLSSSRASAPLALVHCDLLSFGTESVSGSQYLLTIIDDFSRKIFAYPLTRKSEAYSKFMLFKAEAELNSGHRLKVVRSDNGGEFSGHDWEASLDKEGIKHEYSVPYNPQQNGRAERPNRSILEAVRTMLLGSGLSPSLWAEAALAFVYTKNRSPHKALQREGVPESLFTGKPCSVAHLRPFGCRAWNYINGHQRSKLQATAVPLIMVGYSTTSKAWRLLDPLTNKVTLGCHVKFQEDIFPALNPSTLHQPSEDVEVELPPIHLPAQSQHLPTSPLTALSTNQSDKEDDTAEVEDLIGLSQTPPPAPPLPPPTPAPQQYGRGRRGLIPNRQHADFIAHYGSFKAYVLAHRLGADPATYSDVLKHPDRDGWLASMLQEEESLVARKTWEMIPLPPGRKTIPSSWVNKTKYNADGTVERKRSRGVAGGHRQIPNVDFTATYSPVAQFTSIRTLIALAAAHKMALHQCDVDSAYLAGEDLTEEIYMEPLPGSKPQYDEHGNRLVCKLLKPLYGLKQSGRHWYAALTKFLFDLGFLRCFGDECLFVKGEGPSALIIAVYVDDLLIACQSVAQITDFKQALHSRFGIKDLGSAHYILGMQIHRHNDGSILLNQQRYIEDIIDRFSLTGSTQLSTPLPPGCRLLRATDSDQRTDQPYLQALGSLMYAMLGTRPDLAFAVGLLSRFSQFPTLIHWKAMVHAFRYLIGTKSLGILYKAGSTSLVGYSDSAHADDVENSRSTAGHSFLLAGAPISWSSKQQKRVCVSSTEAEYLSLSSSSKSAIFHRTILEQLGFPQNQPTVIYCDNRAANFLATNGKFSSATRSLRICDHNIRELVEEGKLTVTDIRTGDMAADILTKPLSRLPLQRCITLLGLSRPSP